MSDEIKDVETAEPEVTAEPTVEIQAEDAATDDTAATTDDSQKRNGGRPKKDFAMKGDGQQRMPRFKKKMCRFCHDKSLPIDYKRADILENFITDRGKILPRRITGTCARHQRDVAKEIKRARIIALLPFVEK